MRHKYRTDFLLCLFLGLFGVHKFYEKKYLWGTIYLFTFGFFFYGWLYDTIKLAIIAFSYSDDKIRMYDNEQIRILEAKRQRRIELREKYLREKEERRNMDHQVRCPKCGSTQLTANKKGFSLGKAIAGGLILVPIAGVATGMIGKNKIIITCLHCGKQFKPGRGN